MALSTDPEAGHNYGLPDSAFREIENLVQLMQAHIHAISTNGKSLYGEFRTHKPPLFDGSTKPWVAES
ncbi:hypothetical protein DVH24_021737 [Malus domestica]|uniref:Uncharacterized protein n=1 Tax=Malus domestica TaxID=3750 RepID=A0A498KQ17_MALDO|nr:hypothetical protein DVH24_025891 [Malus domestica]RXI09968.1 hypothetical protein DVH24_021737 [Malus domestica]